MADLSKIKIGETVYNLKDADSRGRLATLLGEHAVEVLGSAAWADVDSTITDGATGVASTSAIKTYVDNAVATIHNFDVQVFPTLPTASAKTMYILALVADQHATGTYIEYITVRSGMLEPYTYTWEQIGSTNIDLSGYVEKTTTIAGVNLEDNITKAELQAALELGDLAYGQTASGNTTLSDYVSAAAFSNGAVTASATYTPAGSINVTLKDAAAATSATLTKADYTPAGSVSITPTESTIKVATGIGSVTAGTAASLGATFVQAGTDASFTEGAFTPNTPTIIDISKFNGGSKASDTFNAGALPSLGVASTGSFATGGITAAIDSSDEEMLVFTAATTASAVTAQGTFNAGSLPTFEEGAFTPASLATGFYKEGTAASKANDTFIGGKATVIDTTQFNGGTPTVVTLPTFADTSVMTGATAAFTGTEVKDFQVTNVEYMKQEVDAHTFTGTEASINSTGTATGDVNLTKTNKEIFITVERDIEA